MVAAAVAVLGALLWWAWLPRYRPALRPQESFGVDVSNHQGAIDWAAVRSDGIDFAIIKATEGGDYVDPRFAANWAGAAAAGLDVGAYHFFTLCRDGREQADNFLRAVPPGSADLPPALDLELIGSCTARPAAAWVQEQVEVWLTAVAGAYGRMPLLYVGPDFDERYGITNRFANELWPRRILRRPGGDRWRVWQFSSLSRVDGIAGRVDLNVRRPADPVG